MDQELTNQNQEEAANRINLGPIRAQSTSLGSDMGLVGIFLIIFGALSCLSIIGAVIGIPIIIGGIRLRESAEGFKGFATQGSDHMLFKAVEALSKSMNLFKIIAIIYLVIIVLMIIFYIAFFATMFSAIMNNAGSF